MIEVLFGLLMAYCIFLSLSLASGAPPYQSCPMQDEPEEGGAWFRMLRIERQHEERGAIEPGTDPVFSGSNR